MPRFDGRFFPSSTVSDWAAGKFGSPGWYPNAPTIDTATEGDQSVVLEWTAGSSNGLDITGYQIEKNDGSWSVAVADTGSASGSHTVTGLTNGTAYTFRLKAINSLGASESPSTASASKTPRGVPVAPTGLTLAAHASTPWTHMELSWTAGSANGSAITGYKIQRKTGSGGTYADVVADTGNTNVTYTDSGLTFSTTYYYRVAAINAAGTGSYGTEANRDTEADAFAYTTTGSPTVRTYTHNGTDYKSLQWTGAGTIVVTNVPSGMSGKFDFFAVAGAGGGGYSYAGGGGAGGMQIRTGQTLSTGTHTATVGAGGAGSTSTSTNGANGSNSSFAPGGAQSAFGTGGGGGARGNNHQNGLNGGSGGGGSLSGSGGTGVSGQGYGGGNGYNAYYSQYAGGGGGGGKAETGSHAYTGDGGYTGSGGDGGDGVTSLFANGTATLAGRDGFAGGGPGHGYGSVGAHNALYGTKYWGNAGQNVAYSGAGGSGSGSNSSPQNGATGCVVLRWEVL